MAYLHTVLYTSSYRIRYADVLKRDFPRIPPMHYHEVIAALARTLELQAKLDTAVEAHRGWPLR